MPLMVNGVQVDINAKNNASPVIKQVAADVQALEVQNGNLDSSAGSAGSGIEGLAANVSQLGAVVSIVTVGVGAMVAAFEFGEVAAGNERLRNSGESLAASYGESMDNILAKVREASLGSVSNMDIIASSNKAMMLGVGGNAEQLANLMEIAAFRGRAMGISTSQAFDDMARGIGRMSPMILDNLGIILDAKTTYGNYADSIGKSASELTRSEKIQALLNKVIEEGNRQLEDAGGLAEDNASKYERWNAELENTKNFLMEDFIEMSRFADMGSDLLVGFRDLADNGFGYGGEKLNLFSLFMDFGASRVANMKEELYAAADATAAHGDALDGIVPKIVTLAEVEAQANEVNGDAVKGAMAVHDTYVKLGDKMAGLQGEHDQLLAKKQELIDLGWWPESQKILDVNEKLADNEQKQKDVTVAMQGTLAQMLLNTAAAGLDAEGQLALARATGQIDEATYQTLTAQGLLKKQYEDGTLTADEYARKTLALRDAVARLESKKITITAEAIFSEIRNAVVNTTNAINVRPGSGRATGTKGWEEVPAGYPNDSYPILLTSGEKFAVIPPGGGSAPVGIGGGMGGPINLFLTIQTAVSVNDEQQAKNAIFPFIEEGISRLRAEGKL